MSKPSYPELLQDPRWQRKRLEILERDGFECTNCGDTKASLHVHHQLYDWRSPWEYENETLVTLCADCHKKQTALSRQLRVALSRLDSSAVAGVLGYVNGLIAMKETTERFEALDYDWLCGFSGALVGNGRARIMPYDLLSAAGQERPTRVSLADVVSYSKEDS